jgi:CBS domain-containing protein
MSNAGRFIAAYNIIDNCLRNRLDLGTGVSFSEVVRRAAAKYYIVRENENLLNDYSRLRNAIVHKSTDEFIIAEPHISVVENIERIAGLIQTPPTVLSVFGQRKVTTIEWDAPLIDAIKLISASHYSNIPVYKGSLLKGIINNKIIVDSLGAEAARGGSIDKFVRERAVKSVLDERLFKIYYRLKGKNAKIDDIAQEFYLNRKLVAVLITENGFRTQRPLSIITAYDIMEINKILGDYGI